MARDWPAGVGRILAVHDYKCQKLVKCRLIYLVFRLSPGIFLSFPTYPRYFVLQPAAALHRYGSQTKTPPRAVAFYAGRGDWSSAPDCLQGFQLGIAKQTLRVTPVKQTSGVGRPDPFASMVLQPLRQSFERLRTHCRWGQNRLTCGVHLYTYSLGRERLTYVVIVTVRGCRICLKKRYKTYAILVYQMSPNKKARHGTGLFRLRSSLTALPVPVAAESGNECCHRRATAHARGSSPLRDWGRPCSESLWLGHRLGRRSLGQ